jgi:hypothetical protein
LKLYLDEDLSPRVAVLLRERGLDAIGAHEVDQGGQGDLEQLRYAARSGRCLVTRNVTDFLALVRDLISDAHMQAMAVSTLGPEDVILAISNTGRTRELLETIAINRRRVTDAPATVEETA